MNINNWTLSPSNGPPHPGPLPTETDRSVRRLHADVVDCSRAPLAPPSCPLVGGLGTGVSRTIRTTVEPPPHPVEEPAPGVRRGASSCDRKSPGVEPSRWPELLDRLAGPTWPRRFGEEVVGVSRQWEPTDARHHGWLAVVRWTNVQPAHEKIYNLFCPQSPGLNYAIFDITLPDAHLVLCRTPETIGVSGLLIRPAPPGTDACRNPFPGQPPSPAIDVSAAGFTRSV